MSEAKKQIGLLGGTFDPVHNGHLHIAQHVMTQAKLDEVWFIPACIPPHRDPPLFSAKDRLKMCELALEGWTDFKVCDIEANKNTPCYTYNTIKTLQKQYLDTHFYLIIGMDAFFKIESWHEWERLLKEVDTIVVNRPGFDAPEELNTRHVSLAAIPPCDISATKIRTDLKAHKQDLPEAVLDYITRHNLL